VTKTKRLTSLIGAAPIALLLATAAAQAQAATPPTSVRDYHENLARARQATAGKLDAAQTGYLLGTVEAALAVLRRAEAAGHPPLFCPKRSASLSLGDLAAILADAQAGRRDEAPVQDVLIEALQKRWPCA
jgi:hypothetical protein